MTIVQIEYKKFSDCSDKVKSIILNKHWDWNLHGHWYEYTLDDIKQALEIIGFYNVEVYFSSLHFQGSGAQFVGNYSHEKGALSKIKCDYPQWHELHTLCKALQVAQQKHFYSVSMEITQRGYYTHEFSTSFNFEGYTEKRGHYYLSEEEENPFIECCREFMRYIYKALEEEYAYLTSEAQLIESFNSNRLEFNEEGEIL